MDTTQKDTDKGTDDFATLESYLDITLQGTNNVRKILQEECKEANFVLRPWMVEALIPHDVDENFCTCISKVDVNQEEEEIAVGIDKALAQVQELRQKVARNIAEDKRSLRNNQITDVRKIYTSASTSRKTQQTIQKKLPTSANTSTSIKKSKSTNFIAANKSNVRAISRKNAKATKEQKSEEENYERFTMKKSFPSVTELDNLIKKVSLDSMRKASSATVTSADNNCPCHGADRKTVIKKKLATIDMVDGLERFGVPENLLDILKMYHSYLNDSTKEYSNPKNRPSVKNFLSNFERTNKERQSAFASNSAVTLIQEFPKLLRDLHDKNLDSVALSKMKTKYNELDNLSKKCGIKKYDTLKAKRSGVDLSFNSNCISRGWLSNGIWNWTSLHHFTHLIHIPCVQYTNKNQLLSLFDITQRLQRNIHRNNLLGLLLHDIIPMMKNKLDPTTTEYVEIYKMMFIIAQILNPKLPVLVNTEG